jgi:hypothetical protein
VVLAKNNIEVNGSEADIVLDFLYDNAKNRNKQKTNKRINTLMGNRTY